MQETLFDTNDPFDDIDWKAVDESSCRVARVVFPDGPDGFFDYRIPERYFDSVEPGMRLLVPLGKSNREVSVYCVEVNTATDLTGGAKKFRLKDIIAPIDPKPLLSTKMLDLTQWIAKRYLCSWGQVLEAVLPAGVRGQAGTRLTLVWEVAENADEILAKLQNSAPDQKEILTPKQKRILDILRAAPEPMTLSELARAAKSSMAPIQTLRKMRLFHQLQIRRHNSLFDQIRTAAEHRPPFVPNPGQQAALDRILDAIEHQIYKTFLLHGVTGSGKTEVYIQAIQEVVRYGRQAIVLVPEISLTPQTVRRFSERFQSVAVLHSHLTDTERHIEWSRIAEGKVQVVIGARSAVFAPVPHPGLIVIDEEHETSFKQNIAPRYHAREVAQYRAQQENIPLILGSATPSLESWLHQIKGEYELLTIKDRVLNRKLPKVSMIDLCDRMEKASTRGAVHPQLYQSIRQAVLSGGQVILLLNRRGFSTHIQCSACGEVLSCPDCDIPLTHHRMEDLALCHYCDYQIPIPSVCPKCGSPGFRHWGIGTEKLELELKTKFPGVPVLRMDTDTMQGHGAHERALDAFRRGDYKILLGTQMIAKGLDFPNVTLVGVINADTALHFPDFRASERTFYLITQVAGRTGRGEKGGTVVVQTFSPTHPALMAAAKHDYNLFVGQELKERQQLGYPPYQEMIRFVLRGPEEAAVAQYAAEFGQAIKDSLTDLKKDRAAADLNFSFRIMGPAPAPFARLRGFFRFHIFVYGSPDDLLRERIRQIISARKKAPAGIEWIIDVDPLDML